MGNLTKNADTDNYFGKKDIFIIFSLFLMTFFLAPTLTPAADAATTTMEHSPPDYFVPDHRIQLEAQVEDSEGVKLVRCYFKAAGEADFVFVPMNLIRKNKYSGILPAPSATTNQIEYLFLAVNNSKKVVRSQTFTMSKDADEDPPAWQEVPKQGEIKVSMELDKVPTQLRGFSDSVTIDAVESGARFGVVALLYHNLRDSDSSKRGGSESASSSSTSGSATSSTAAGSSAQAASGSTASSAAVASATAATGATSAGVITAGAVGWSTAAIVGVGVGAAAAVGGTAAAVSGGSSSGGNDDGDDGNDDVIDTKCDSATFPGGDTPETHSVDLGRKSGTFIFEYETYFQEDRMIVSYEGNVLFDTGCVGANGTQPISYSGNSSKVTVEVIPNCNGGSGTSWEFTVNCPQ